MADVDRTPHRSAPSKPALVAVLAAVAVVGLVALVTLHGPSAPAATTTPRTLAQGPDAFEEWQVKFGREYFSEEERAMRRAIFLANLDLINAHNAAGQGWTMAVGEFTDLTQEEFRMGRLIGYVPPASLRTQLAAVRTRSSLTSRSLRHEAPSAPQPSVGTLPRSSLDWSTTKNPRGFRAVTPVLNQGACENPWAFAAAGSMEGNGALFTPPAPGTASLIPLSIQQITACANTAYGCAGGMITDALNYAKVAGVCSQTGYAPYNPDNSSCVSASCQILQSRITKYTNCISTNPNSLQSAAQTQPVAVAVDGNGILLQHYSSGVITSTSCTANVDHAALVVGYGNFTNTARTPYWKLKNSWGSWWGVSGFFLVARGPGYDTANSNFGICGVYGSPSYPSF